MNTGNQYVGRAAALRKLLRVARQDLQRARILRADKALSAHYVAQARAALALYRAGYEAAPASTQRRWRVGR
jgi:multidrug resistance efflux pump